MTGYGATALRGRANYISERKNGYSVIKCRVKGYQDLITVVGIMPETHVGSVLTLGGSWRVDSKYGRQFSVETYEETLPATSLRYEELKGYAGPVLLIHGSYARTLKAIYPDCRYEEIAGGGHVFKGEADGQACRILRDFMRSK